MTLRIRPLGQGVPLDLGRPDLPGSKSHTQRAMVLAAFTPGSWELQGALRSIDTEVLAAALERCGARVHWTGGSLLVEGSGTRHIDAQVDFGENGTALRVLLVVVPLLGGRLLADGAEGLRRRPLRPALVPLQAANATVTGERLPLAVDGAGLLGPLPPMAAGVTTQAATGAMLGLALRSARRGEPATLRVQRAQARGYLAVTVAVLRSFGFQVQEEAHGDEQHFTFTGQPMAGGRIVIPVDPSARVFPMSLAALHGRDAGVLLPAAEGDPHPDWAVDQDLEALRTPAGDLELPGLTARPDCVPALAAVAANRRGRTRLPQLATLRGKESDRLQAIALGLCAAGASCRVAGDDLLVAGPLPRTPVLPRELPAPADHRIVMSLALLGTVLPGGVALAHEAAVAKSWPGFFAWLGRVADVTG